jgi:polysaccharide pyruvyl transferase WcaK-like protein
MKPKKFALFGHFGGSNFGNESSLMAMLYNLRRFYPDADVVCICTHPRVAAATYRVRAIPVVETRIQGWTPKRRPARLLRKVCMLCIGIPLEAYSWAAGLVKLRRTDMFIVPGTGLLTDAFGLFAWGPYIILKWTLIARLCGSKVCFISVGAGPFFGVVGTRLMRFALALADVRTYRDESTKETLASIGIDTADDLVYPDLVYSFPREAIPTRTTENARRIVGLGCMEPSGRYSTPRPGETMYRAYVDSLVTFAEELIADGYGLRLLAGDRGDLQAQREFCDLLNKRMPGALAYVNDDLISSVEDLLAQMADTDLVVATRFHGALMALLCGKPVVSISFHQKCTSAMAAMGLSEYSLDMSGLTAEKLMKSFRDLERDAPALVPLIRTRASSFRTALDEQYEQVFGGGLWTDPALSRSAAPEAAGGALPPRLSSV